MGRALRLHSWFSSAAALLFLYFPSVSCLAVPGPVDYDYSEGPKGPAHWGDLETDWRLCKTGKKQSPINIPLHDAVIKNGGLTHKLRTSYFPTLQVVAYLAPYNVMLDFGNYSGGIILHSTYYSLRNLHTHIPSEHAVDGRRFPLEAHLVHKTPDGKKVAVIGLLFTYGKADPVFDKVLDVLFSLANSSESTFNTSFPTTNLRISGKAYDSYSGSLSTPPCSEEVLWTVLSKPRTVSEEQVRKFQIVYPKNNARPTQPINSRHIYYHGA